MVMVQSGQKSSDQRQPLPLPWQQQHFQSFANVLFQRRAAELLEESSEASVFHIQVLASFTSILVTPQPHGTRSCT